MTELQGDQSKIDPCTMEENLGKWEHSWGTPRDPNGYVSIDLEQTENVLPVRLTDETFRGIMNFLEATKKGASTDQIQKALVNYTYMWKKYKSQNL